MIRQFVRLNEAAEMLNCDPDGLIQALELGLGDTLPVYVHLKGWGCSALFVGPGIETKFGLNGGLSCTVQIPEFGEFTDDGCGFEWLRDPFCEVTSTYEQSSIGGFILQVQGYIRVCRTNVLDCARCFDAHAEIVAPSSWWATSSPIPKNSDGEPKVFLMLLPTDDQHQCTVEKFLFKIEDIEALKASRARAKVNGIKDHIDPRTETTLLVMIGALATKAGIDLAHQHTAAKEVSLLLDGDVKLDESTIARQLKKVREAIDSRKR